MLELKKVVSGYGMGQVLKGVNLTVHEGEIVALLGANGVGKSTTLLTIAGVLQHWSGEISLCGESLRGLRADQILQKGLGLCPEARRIFPRLTVKENLSLGGYLQKNAQNAQRLEMIFAYFPKLKERLQQLGGTLSGGEQQMLAIGRALMACPKLLMLDEPSLGLAPSITQKIFSLLQNINQQEKVTILLVEQNARQALRIAHRGYVMVGGVMKFHDTAQALMDSDEVRKAYLGETD